MVEYTCDNSMDTWRTCHPRREERTLMKKRLICLALICALLISLVPSGLAAATLNYYATGSFSRNLDVYTGPGTQYYRTNNGKASYGGGTARIYGSEGDWLLIGYMLKDGAYRIGYVTRDALAVVSKVKGSIKPLQFDYAVAYADDYCRMTDDPVMNQKMFYTIPEGTQVTVLATMGEKIPAPWTYIEVQSPNGPMRGFVWSIHLKYASSGSSGGASNNSSSPASSNSTYVTPTNPPASQQGSSGSTAAPQVRPTQEPPYIINFYHDSAKGDWLPKYQELKFTGSWPVYSGPGDYYYRANNSKATMGGGYCRVYGRENNWILIGYGLSDGRYRFGYVKQDALPHISLNIPFLDLKYTTRQLQMDAKLTDDIARYRNTLVSLPKGTYVLFLGYVSEANITWAYVEVMANNSIMRGFIPATALAP